jgi:hypothetical protein
MPRRAFGGRATCESYLSIDVREWHRRGLLRAGKRFSCTWTRDGEQSGSIGVRREADSVVLAFQWRGPQSKEWESVEQRVPLVWTRCHLGGKRPWFICAGLNGGPRCGRRVAMLYAGDPTFACRACCGLAYASQSEGLHRRSVRRAQNIRMRLGGGPSLHDRFPEKPLGMHWRTYYRLAAARVAAEERSTALLYTSALSAPVHSR